MSLARAREWAAAWPARAAGGTALVLYALTAAREPQFGDGLELVAAAAVGGVPHPPGYPLMTTLFAPAAHGASAYLRCTLLCAVAAALAVMAITRLTAELVGAFEASAPAERFLRRWLPLSAGLTAACSASLWSAATQVEVYGLGAALVAGALLVLVPGNGLSGKRLFLGGLLVGLAASHHLTALALAPVLAWRAWQGRTKGLLAAASGFGAGLLPLLLLPIRAAGQPPINWGNAQTWEGFRWMLSGGDYKHGQFMQEHPGTPFSASTWVDFAVRRVVLVVCGFGAEWTGGLREVAGAGKLAGAAILGSGAWLLVAIGARELKRLGRGAAAATLALPAALQLAFLFLYNIPDIADYLLGVWVCIAPLTALGALAALRHVSRALGYEAGPEKARRLAVFLALPVLLGLSGNFATTNKAPNRLARAWIERLIDALPENTLLLTHSDYDTYAAWYAQLAERRRPDVLIVPGGFLRQRWITTMLPIEAPDTAGRRVLAEPGDVFEQRFTAEDHAAMLVRAAIAPNLGRVPVFGTDLPRDWPDPMFAELRRLHPAQPRAVLLSPEEWLFMSDTYPTIAPPMLVEFVAPSSNGAAPP